MPRRIVIHALLVAACALAPAPGSALSLKARTDNAVSAWRSRTGEKLWSHVPPALSDAWFEIFSHRLSVHAIVYPESGSSYELDLFLDADTGEPGLAPAVGASPEAASHVGWPREPIVLDNGWRLVGFVAGTDQELVFEDDTGAAKWTLELGVYADEVDSWRNTVIWADAYLGDDGIVHAHEALAAGEAWQFDPNAHLALPELLTRPYFRVMGDDLYVGVHEHVFELDPLDGSVKRKWDLAALTGLPWEADFDAPGFFSGGLDLGSFSRDAETLVVGFERRLVALDRASGALLWHADPGAFPIGGRTPLNHSGVVYLVSAPEVDAGVDVGAAAEDGKASGCDCRTVGARSPEGATALIGALALLALRRRQARLTDRRGTRSSPRCR